jgi:hypothetical protein
MSSVLVKRGRSQKNHISSKRNAEDNASSSSESAGSSDDDMPMAGDAHELVCYLMFITVYL